MKCFVASIKILVLVISFSVSITLSSAFANGVTTVSIQPSASNLGSGSTFDLLVDIANVSDLYAFQFDIGFDPAILSASNVTEGSFLPNGGRPFSFPELSTILPG